MKLQTIDFSIPLLIALGLLLSTFCTEALAGEPANESKREDVSQPIPLWNGVAPGEKGDIGEEHDAFKSEPNADPKKRIILLSNITKPTITVYRPEKEKDKGVGVIVCPGGGYSILAYDLEGTEICKWFNSVGVTAFLLKYRVPSRKGLEKHTASLQDAQRAVSMVRSRAKEWGVAPNHIGILGFSAGGHLTAMTSTTFDKRSYTAVDDSDKESCRPDFSMLIYPAYLTRNDDLSKIAPELTVTAKTPPTFIVMAQDDPVKVECALTYAMALQHEKVPIEMHIYPKGGHGYGLREGNFIATDWPKRAARWLRNEILPK